VWPRWLTEYVTFLQLQDWFLLLQSPNHFTSKARHCYSTSLVWGLCVLPSHDLDCDLVAASCHYVVVHGCNITTNYKDSRTTHSSGVVHFLPALYDLDFCIYLYCKFHLLWRTHKLHKSLHSWVTNPIVNTDIETLTTALQLSTYSMKQTTANHVSLTFNLFTPNKTVNRICQPAKFGDDISSGYYFSTLTYIHKHDPKISEAPYLKNCTRRFKLIQYRKPYIVSPVSHDRWHHVTPNSQEWMVRNRAR